MCMLISNIDIATPARSSNFYRGFVICYSV
jgi:hypothetical protein